MAAVEAPVIVYEPHTRGLPHLRRYLRQLWGRREFVWELARSDLRAKHLNTVFGQAWTVLNPLMLAGVYFFLIGVLLGGPRATREYLALLVGGLFFFFYSRNALNFGTKSVVGGGKLIMNTAFPRAMLPVSAVVMGLLTFLPTAAVWVVIPLLLGQPVGTGWLVIPLLLLIQTAFNLGLAMVLAAVQVYFRDAQNFLPYIVRIWMYLTPVLWTLEHVPAAVRPWLQLNPLFPLFAAYQEAFFGRLPPIGLVVAAAAWALGALALGGLFFLSREREFAVRI
jgi:ABC-type polysaccharide/polyol phosphate export permease